MRNLYRLVLGLYGLWILLAIGITLLILYGFDSPKWLFGYLFVLGDLALVLFWANVRLHQRAKQGGLCVNTIGFKETLLSCLLFTPMEAVIVLPAINLYRLRHTVLVEKSRCG